MKKILNERITQIIAVISVVVIAVLFWTATDSNQNPNDGVAYKINKTSTDGDFDDNNEYEKNGITKFNKVKLNKYEMSFKSVIKSDDESEEKAETSDNEDESSFSVDTPDEVEVTCDPQPGSMGYISVRSVADEYFNVYDLNTSKVYTENAHELLCLMVNNEIGDSWNENAIKAQVVAAYSHLRFCDSRNIVTEIGLKYGYSDKIERCVSAVEGQCVYYEGEIANTLYSAASAGTSSSAERLWGANYPYMIPVVSEYDYLDPYYGIRAKISKDKVQSAISRKFGIELSDNPKSWFKIDSMACGKYVDKVIIDNQKTISGEDLRALLDLKSAAFEISYSDNDFIFKTYGYGHGAGMSQYGACLYASHGYTYDQILRHYYYGTTVRLSDVCQNAVQRGKKKQEELEKEHESKEAYADVQSSNASSSEDSNTSSSENSDNDDSDSSSDSSENSAE